MNDQTDVGRTVISVTNATTPVAAIDLFGTNRTKITGWERYALNLYGALAVSAPLDLKIAALESSPSTSSRVDHLRRALWHYFVGTKTDLAASGASIYHATTFPPGLVPRNVKVVWTVHDDLILGGHAEFARRGGIVWNRLARRRLHRVDAFVTSTHTVRGELIALGVDPAKIHLVSAPSTPLAAATTAPTVTTLSGETVTLPERFVLVVGTLEPRKRVDLSTKIAAQAGLPIVLVGHHSNVDLSTLNANTLLAAGVSDGELAWCYDNAVALLSTSAYEGINLPLFEAAERGLPVVASDIDVHRELAGKLTDRVKLVDPIDTYAAAAALVAAVGAGRQAPMRILASYDELAEQHLAIYRGLCS